MLCQPLFNRHNSFHGHQKLGALPEMLHTNCFYQVIYDTFRLLSVSTYDWFIFTQLRCYGCMYASMHPANK